MNDIKQMILRDITNDATLVSLMGITDIDPRVYYYYQGEASVQSQTLRAFDPAATPAYITYTQLGAGETSTAVEKPVFSIRIWARENEYSEKIGASLKRLWDKKDLQSVGSTEYPQRQVHGRLVNRVDLFQEQPNFAGLDMHFRFSSLEISQIS